MINLTFNVENISVVILVYDQIQIMRSDSENGAYEFIDALGPVTLVNGTSSYTITDITGLTSNWYISRYYSTSNGFYSEWSSPVIGSAGTIFYDPLYPPEVNYEASKQIVIDRIRKFIGDPVRLNRQNGAEATVYVHKDGKTFELPETGWPASIVMNGTVFNSLSNPSVNNYRYLRFNSYIGGVHESTVTYSGIYGLDSVDLEEGIDIWYYTFRNSDRQIMEAYNDCPVPYPLTTDIATSEVYMLQTSIDILRQELIEDSIENGATVNDDVTVYNPTIGLNIRKAMLDDLQKKLDNLIKRLMMTSVTGVLID